MHMQWMLLRKFWSKVVHASLHCYLLYFKAKYGILMNKQTFKISYVAWWWQPRVTKQVQRARQAQDVLTWCLSVMGNLIWSQLGMLVVCWQIIYISMAHRPAWKPYFSIFPGEQLIILGAAGSIYGEHSIVTGSFDYLWTWFYMQWKFLGSHSVFLGST